MEEHVRGLGVCALNVEENTYELLLLKHLDLHLAEYLAAIKVNKVTSWENGLKLNTVVNVSSEDLETLAETIS